MKLLEKYDSVVIYDTETTGLDPREEQIIELAMIRFEKGKKPEIYDNFIKLENGKEIPEEITNLTGITKEHTMNGVDLSEAGHMFLDFACGNTLLCAYNAGFDMGFIARTVGGHEAFCAKTANNDYLDLLTVYKDRREYPHKLKDAISEYKLTKVSNSHHALDDVWATAAVMSAMQKEREDLDKYVNLFGYNPRYGRPVGFKRVRQLAQPYIKNISYPLPLEKTAYGKIRKK